MASSQLARRSTPPSRTRGWVRRSGWLIYCYAATPFGQSLPLLWVSIRGSTPTTSPAATRRCMPHWTPQNAQWVETQRSSALSVSQPPVASAPAEWRSATPGGVGYLVLRARRRRRLVLIVRSSLRWRRRSLRSGRPACSGGTDQRGAPRSSPTRLSGSPGPTRIWWPSGRSRTTPKHGAHRSGSRLGSGPDRSTRCTSDFHPPAAGGVDASGAGDPLAACAQFYEVPRFARRVFYPVFLAQLGEVGLQVVDELRRSQRLTAAGAGLALGSPVHLCVHLDADRRRPLQHVEELAERDERQRQHHRGHVDDHQEVVVRALEEARRRGEQQPGDRDDDEHQ